MANFRADMTRELTDQQNRQEAQYDFPYHYIPHFHRGRFRQVRVLRDGYQYLSYLDFLMEQLGRRPFASLLDVGCGDGRFLHELLRRFDGRTLTGVDISGRAIEYARAVNPDVTFIAGDVTDSGTIDDRFDVVTCVETLEHIPIEQVDGFVAGLRRCLADGGRLLLTAPSKNVSQRAKHYQHFDVKSLTAALTPHFEVQECFYLNRRCLRTRILHRLLTNSLFLLNEKHLVNWLYGYYGRHLLMAEAHNAARLCVVCEKG